LETTGVIHKQTQASNTASFYKKKLYTISVQNHSPLKREPRTQTWTQGLQKVGQSHVPNDARDNVAKGVSKTTVLTAKDSLPFLILDVLAHIARKVTAILLQPVHRVTGNSETLGSFLNLA
jgi:hypothetical protein